mgnify:FL=1
MNDTQIHIQKNTSGELFFEIPPSLLEDLGWQEGDDLEFVDNKTGVITIKKVKYSTIELYFDDDELFKYMKFAHERNQSFNELVCESVQEVVKAVDNRDQPKSNDL